TGSIKSTLDKHAGTGLVNNRNNFHYEDLESLDRNMLSAVYDDHESWDTTFGDKIKNLEELMRFLNPSQQAVFILYSYGGLKGGKLADKLGVSKSRISSIFKDAKQRINRIKKARAIFKELLETDGVGDLNEAILGHFAPVINEEIKRQKRNVFYKYAVREKGTKGFPLIELSKEDIAELLKLTTIGRMIELDILLNKYVELVHNLRAIGIYEGFNLYLDTMSVFIMYGKEKIKTQEKIRMLDVAKTHGVNQDSVKNTMRKLLDRAGYGNMASPFLVDYMNGNGLELEDVKETDIPDLLERFPVKTINKEELDKMFRVYIAHVRLMKKIGINKGRTVPENLISAFLNLAGKNTEITVAKIGRKALSRNMQLISYLGAMVKRLETHNGRMDIFAASSSEDIVFRKAFLVELSAVSDKQRIQDVLRSSI
ncbi:MAG: hypothetical protein KKB21_03370, partial [Nanoarchaeota archaeon]|nr:hypothetical protein [Nanoarchaeota archaeon]